MTTLTVLVFLLENEEDFKTREVVGLYEQSLTVGQSSTDMRIDVLRAVWSGEARSCNFGKECPENLPQAKLKREINFFGTGNFKGASVLWHGYFQYLLCISTTEKNQLGRKKYKIYSLK